MKKMLILSIMVMAVIFLFIPIFPVFSFTETRAEDPEMYYADLHKEKSFQFVFTHSIHLTDVTEVYEVLPGHRIRPVSMQYSDVAIGMPGHAGEGQTLVYEDGMYTLHYEEQSLPGFSIYIGDVAYDLAFLYDGQAYNLKKNLQRGKSYLFEVEKVSFYEKLKGVELHGG